VKIIKRGIIQEIINPLTFIVVYDENSKMTAQLSRSLKLRLRKPIEIGDEVIIHMSPYDLLRGRIDRRSFEKN